MCPLIYVLRVGTIIIKKNYQLLVVKIIKKILCSFHLCTIVSFEIVEGIGSLGTVECRLLNSSTLMSPFLFSVLLLTAPLNRPAHFRRFLLLPSFFNVPLLLLWFDESNKKSNTNIFLFHIFYLNLL